MIDLQVNGFAGVDFNSDDLNGDDLLRAALAQKKLGIEKFLPTLITAPFQRMIARAIRLAKLIEESEELSLMIPGIHLEGPFISDEDGYRGAHPREGVRSADLETAKSLLDACGGRLKLLTLAPECDPYGKVTSFLSSEGVVVAAGHTNATLDQLRDSIDSGLGMFTHLGNACPAQLPRHDNIIQRVLALSNELWISYIADGVHLPFFVLRNLFRISGLDRSIIVSDAISATGCPPGSYTLGNQKIEISEDGLSRAQDGSHLIGSTTSLAEMRANLTDDLGFSSEEADLSTSINPAQILGL